MNKKKNNFIQSPNHNIKITPYWFLGLIEGASTGKGKRGESAFLRVAQATQARAQEQEGSFF